VKRLAVILLLELFILLLVLMVARGGV